MKVRLPGLGIYSPRVRLDGTMYPSVRVDMLLRRSLTSVDAFHGGIVHRESIGMDVAAVKERWDREHPDDPMGLPLQGAGGKAA